MPNYRDPSERDDDRVQIIPVEYCEGRRWLTSPAKRAVYYLASLSPDEKAQAIMQGVHALAEHDARPKLRLIHSPRTPERSAG